VTTPSQGPFIDVATAVTQAASLNDAARRAARALATALSTAIAILSHGDDGWRFEADGAPPHGRTRAHTADVPMPLSPPSSGTTPGWTGVLVGRVSDRDWMLMLPGDMDAWSEAAGLEQFVTDLRDNLERVAIREESAYARRLQRRLYGLTRRLTSTHTNGRVSDLVLRAMCAQTRARVGALAKWMPAENALAITGTVGYPVASVEHLRLRPGQGILGEVFVTRRPMFVTRQTTEGTRRLRYATDSFMVLPVLVGSRCAAVIALTDRADGRPFDARDFESARLIAAQAAAGFLRERINEDMSELARIATVDPLTGLFNRRYSEDRLTAELQRALRQERPLALMMIDIDDFKRINDTLGHLEGDRALRDVADLLRTSVRIFDVCARFGGEEFVIIMPGASADVATQVAERIRVKVEQAMVSMGSSLTISVGIGTLGTAGSAQDLLASADRALMAAKSSGKNAVWLEDSSGSPRRMA
jgi:diguanylate cyclase (GGDEF)-like protein